MNISSQIVAVLRSAGEPLNNVAIREQIAELDDVAQLTAQHLVSDAINDLVKRGHIERIWSEGRCAYVVAPDAPDLPIGADPGIEVGATRHSGDPLPPVGPQSAIENEITSDDQIPNEIRFATVLVPSPAQANPMHAVQHKIINVLEKAGGSLSHVEIAAKLPSIEEGNLKYHRGLLQKNGLIVSQGATSNRRYSLPGKQATPQADSDQPREGAAASKESKPLKRVAAPKREKAASTAALPIASLYLSLVDLRSAAADILLSHGSDPLPRALHRLVTAAIGAPESAGA